MMKRLVYLVIVMCAFSVLDFQIDLSNPVSLSSAMCQATTILVTDFENGLLHEFDMDGNLFKTYNPSFISVPKYIQTLDENPFRMLVLDGGNGVIHIVDRNLNLIKTFGHELLSGASAITLDQDKNIYVSCGTHYTGEVVVFNRDGNHLYTLDSEEPGNTRPWLRNLKGIAYCEAKSTLFVGVQWWAPAGISEIDPITGQQLSSLDTGGESWVDMEFGTDGKLWVVDSTDDSQLYKFDPFTGQKTGPFLDSQFPMGTFGITFAEDGSFFVNTYVQPDVRYFDPNMNLVWVSDGNGVLGKSTKTVILEIANESPSNPLSLSVERGSNMPVATNETIAYHICFETPDSVDITGANIVSQIPDGTAFVSATEPYIYNPQSQTVTWNFESIEPGAEYCRDLSVSVNASEGEILLLVTINSDNYLSTTRQKTIQVDAEPATKKNIPPGTTKLLPISEQNTPWGSLSLDASDGLFHTDLPTVVISHGWNNLFENHKPEWMDEMAEAIGDRANVLLWDWHDKAKSHIRHNYRSHPEIWVIPYDNVPKSGEYLARALENILPEWYTGKIHFIGFSLGSGVIVHAAGHLDKYKHNLDQLTLLDSPYYFLPPALGTFVKIQDTTFIDNYWSALGRQYGYPFLADTNVYLLNYEAFKFKDPHGYAHLWYQSSMSNFDTDLLPTKPPTNDTKPYGFYWSAAVEKNDGDPSRSDASHLYCATLKDRWKLYTVEEKIETAKAKLIFAVEAAKNLTQDVIDELTDMVEKTGKTIKVVAVNTFTTFAEANEFVTDLAGHAIWEATGGNYGYVMLEITSDAVITSQVAIPAEANAMKFSFNFMVADRGGILEAFLEDVCVFRAYSDDYREKGVQSSDWIDVSSVAGKQVSVSFRMSNLDNNKQGIVALDDIIFAKIGNDINNSNPIVDYNDGLAVDFGTKGLYYYKSGGWSKISTNNPEWLAAYSDKLVADFGATYGLYQYDGTSWSQISTADADNTGNTMVAYNNGLAVDFGASGLWYYDGVYWSRMSTSNVQWLTSYNGNLGADFDTFWHYDGSSWSQISLADADNTENTMVSYNNGLAVDFGSKGLYYYKGGSWSQISTNNVQWLGAYSDKLVADFGATYGLWQYDGASWTKISTGDVDN